MSRGLLRMARVRSIDTLCIKRKRAKVTVLNLATFLSVLLALIPFFIVIGALSTSWPGLTRPSTSLVRLMIQDVDARDKRGHDESTIVSIGIRQSTFTLCAQILMNHVFFLAECATHLFSFWRWKWPEQISLQCQSRHF